VAVVSGLCWRVVVVMAERPPVEPSADLRMLASFLRQTFLALIAEGFTEHQALVIVGQMIAANTGES
jgi:hypothetical protein